MLQPKTLHFRYFILKVQCFLQFFGQPHMTTILLQDQFHHLFYQYPVKKTVFLIFQLTFVQDSKMLLLPQFQTTVTHFLDMTWHVQFLKIIATFANTGKGWLNQTLQLVVWIYAARMILICVTLSTAIRRLEMYAHLKIIFNGMSYSHLPVTWENILVKKTIREWLDDKKWKMNFSYWDTYSFFWQQEIKRALQQAALGRFLQVWGNFSAIFTDYIGNSTSRPLMKMLEVFAHK